jgi:Leucine-rich repeat (LRR) protein
MQLINTIFNLNYLNVNYNQIAYIKPKYICIQSLEHVLDMILIG